MGTVEEIEAAIRALPIDDQKVLALKLNDLYWSAWDEQIEVDAADGRLDSIIAEVENDIRTGKTKPLDEIIDNS